MSIFPIRTARGVGGLAVIPYNVALEKSMIDPPDWRARMRLARYAICLSLTVLFAMNAAWTVAANLEIAPLVKQLQAVGPKAAGHAAASQVWQQLVRADVAQLPAMLAALDRAGPLAANWIATAIDTVAQRGLAQGGVLPVAALEEFILDRQHSPRARRLAYEWLVCVQSSARERLLPGMLDDPSVELRRDALARLMDQAAAVPATEPDRAVALYRQAMSAARDRDQSEAVAQRLGKLGVPVDLVRHFGYVTHWKLIAPFDNAGEKGFDAVYPPEHETQFDASCEGKHGSVKWLDYTSSDAHGYNDFHKAVAEEKSVVGYAAAVFSSARRQEVEIRMSSCNALKLWLNGEVIGRFQFYHSGEQPDQFVSRAVLHAGRNQILLKVCQNAQTEAWTHRWGFQFRVCDASGGAILSTERDEDAAVKPKTPEKTAPGTEGKEKEIANCKLQIANCKLGKKEKPHAVAGQGDWLQFLGNEVASESAGKDLPTSFGPAKNVAWKVPLPGCGPSSPIVVGGRVIVTAASGPRQDRLHVMAFDEQDGGLLWERQLWATGPTICHPFSGVAAATPASDGQSIVAMFSSNDLACFDLDGNLLWLRGLNYENPTTRNDAGMASSPLVVGREVIVQLENLGESFAAAIDLSTGRTLWQIPRDHDQSWSSPILLRGRTPADDAVLLQSRSHLTAHDPRTGKELWRYPAACSTISSPAVEKGRVILPADGLSAVQYDAAAGEAKTVWSQKRARAENASPVVHAGRVYAMKSGGILACLDAADGNVLWQLRLGGVFWATPVVAGGRLYAASHGGQVQVVELGAEGRIVGTGQLEPGLLASPAVAGDALFFRSNAHLWKIATPKKTAED
jgi:outer membrane protein assembly factor BamB